jgi:hypothetical protein
VAHDGCDKLRARYETIANSGEQIARAMAKRQLAAIGESLRPERSLLPLATSLHDSVSLKPSKWRHVPLAELFGLQGNLMVSTRGQKPPHGPN